LRGTHRGGGPGRRIPDVAAQHLIKNKRMIGLERARVLERKETLIGREVSVRVHQGES